MKDLMKKIKIPDPLDEYHWKNKSLRKCDKDELISALREALTEIERLQAKSYSYPFQKSFPWDIYGNQGLPLASPKVTYSDNTALTGLCKASS